MTQTDTPASTKYDCPRCGSPLAGEWNQFDCEVCSTRWVAHNLTVSRSVEETSREWREEERQYRKEQEQKRQQSRLYRLKEWLL